MKFHIHPFLTTISIYHTTAYTVLVPGKRALCSTRTSSLERTSIWSMFSDTHTHTHVFFGWQENSSLRIITAPTWRMWCESQALLWFLCPNDKTKKVQKHYIYIYIYKDDGPSYINFYPSSWFNWNMFPQSWFIIELNKHENGIRLNEVDYSCHFIFKCLFFKWSV